MYKHILLPTDGSELSERAVKSGVELAKALGAKVTGLYVIVESRVAAGIGKAMRGEDQSGREAAEDYLRVISDQAKRAGVQHEVFHVTGDSPWEEIINAAGAKGCDLVFMASHGRRGVAGLLLGSQTTLVLTHSKLPVLVCR